MSKLFEAKFAAITARMDDAMRVKEGIVSSTDDVDTDTQNNSDDDTHSNTTSTATTAKRGKGKATAKRALTAPVDDSTDSTTPEGKQKASQKARHDNSDAIEVVDSHSSSSNDTDTDDDEAMFEDSGTTKGTQQVFFMDLRTR
jgi:hypothetical protein